MKNLKVQLIYPNTILPKKAYSDDVGYDLSSRIWVTLNPGQREDTPLGIKLQIPSGYYVEIISRSGLATKHGIVVLNSPGIIDNGYRGEIFATLINLGKEKYCIGRGDRVAQMIIKKQEYTRFIEVDEILPTERGEKGCGSSGV